MALEFAAFVLAFMALLVTLYIWADQHILRRDLKQEKRNRENHAREEIYKILRGIPEVREWRERIRNKSDAELSFHGVTRESEMLFSNRRVMRIICSLSFTLALYSEHFPEQFIKRVNDAINGYDFILNRLELKPMEIDDPGDILNESDKNKGFIDELKDIR